MIIDPIIRGDPISPEYPRKLLIIRSVQERIKPVDLVNHCDVDHSHDHDPKVKEIFKKDIFGLTLVFGCKHCLKNVLEGKHPAAIH